MVFQTEDQVSKLPTVLDAWLHPNNFSVLAVLSSFHQQIQLKISWYNQKTI